MKNVCFPFARSLVVAALAVAAQGSWAETITVSAAASLKDAFTELAQKYEASNPQDKVQLNFGGSGALFQQIEKGAPVDVFASADEKTMDKAEQARLVVEGTRQTFVTNTLVLIQPAKGQAQLDSLQSLQDKAVARIAIGNPESVPVGRYTKAALEAARQWDALQPKLILAQNVRQALDYVARAEVDAGFVYGTDAALMKDKVKVAYVVPVEKTVSYPIAVMKTGAQEAAAKRFVALVTSPIGQGVLKSYGFVPAVK
ncbi:molybdate ABC transporter substrate-binding protein [Allofranklinella schreckenbergeri]|uniref:Molybdate ABC transporter substrate-binding protein n=1 Tax=Allofranklinella schreckenbergeri TaxID=1076744 RepID=A0A3M6R8C0_9BURK|nr:molybdate ABC transporter substrate-binding protein [Allofranklinella schreckenbergeri]MDO4705626.1 molybdate ABC transporter substrate-binding protein [Comamonadaceae bacterium]RMX11039.1 molybdate ABC transporter substrate-binding protein [Allofranklinella schreckenbergeri]